MSQFSKEDFDRFARILEKDSRLSKRRSRVRQERSLPYSPYKHLSDEFIMKRSSCFFVEGKNADPNLLDAISISWGKSQLADKWILMTFKNHELIDEQYTQSEEEVKVLFKLKKREFQSIAPTEKQLKHYQKCVSPVNRPKQVENETPKVFRRKS